MHILMSGVHEPAMCTLVNLQQGMYVGGKGRFCNYDVMTAIVLIFSKCRVHVNITST